MFSKIMPFFFRKVQWSHTFAKLMTYVAAHSFKSTKKRKLTPTPKHLSHLLLNDTQLHAKSSYGAADAKW